MNLTFLGAAREVTGSCYLVETDGVRFLVDCGMFQGGRTAEASNRAAPEFDPEAIDFILLTHAHIDHAGLLPRLVAMGFKGPVYCTEPTRDLLGVMLPDSAHLQEKEAEWETRHRHRARLKGGRRQDVAPLYTVAQAHASLRHLTAMPTTPPCTPTRRCGSSSATPVTSSAPPSSKCGWMRRGRPPSWCSRATSASPVAR